MRQLTRREKIVLTIGAAAVALFVYLFALLLPARRALASATGEVAQIREKLEQAEVMYREAMAARDQIASLKQQTQSLMCPWPDVQSGMVGEIQKLSQELGITLSSIRPAGTESADGSTLHPAELKVEGDLGKIVRLLYELEQPGRRLWVQGVEITSARQAGGKLIASINIAPYSPARGSETVNAEG